MKQALPLQINSMEFIFCEVLDKQNWILMPSIQGTFQKLPFSEHYGTIPWRTGMTGYRQTWDFFVFVYLLVCL